MALPTISVHSGTGSDTQASGAGPSTALFGTTDASTDGAGTTVTLTAGTDLTNVAVDGSHVIFLNDTTAGARNFGKITGKAGSGGATPTVTVANAFGLTMSSKSWAIGGKRASIGGTTSKKLLENNSAAGDAMPGWIIQMESGHAETIAAAIRHRRSGDTTDGPIVVCGVSSAATRPVVTFSNNGDAFEIHTAITGVVHKNYTLLNSSGGASSQAFTTIAASSQIELDGLTIGSQASFFAKGFVTLTAATRISNSEFAYCSNTAIDGCSSGTFNCLIENNNIHHSPLGIVLSATNATLRIDRNRIWQCSTTGIVDGLSSATVGYGATIERNTIDACGNGVTVTGTNQILMGTVIENNNITNCTTAVAMSATAAVIAGYRPVVRNNNTYGSTTPYSPAAAGDYGSNDPSVNPGYRNRTSGDFRGGSILVGEGWPETDPSGVPTGSRSYAGIGAYAQRGSGGLRRFARGLRV